MVLSVYTNRNTCPRSLFIQTDHFLPFLQVISIALDKRVYKVNSFLIWPWKPMLWIFIRSASIYVFMEKLEMSWQSSIPPTICLSLQIAKVEKGHNSFLFFSKVNQVIYSSTLISSPSFKALAQIDIEMSCQEKCDKWTDKWTNSNIPLLLLQSWGHKKKISIVPYLKLWMFVKCRHSVSRAMTLTRLHVKQNLTWAASSENMSFSTYKQHIFRSFCTSGPSPSFNTIYNYSERAQ